MKNWPILSTLIALLALSACNPTSRFAQQRYDDDLYYVSSGEAARRADAAPAQRPSGTRPSTYEEYQSGRTYDEQYANEDYDQNDERYNSRDYSRNLDRYNDPLWYDPSFSMGLGMGMGMGMGGYWGSRSYMLFNPYFPPFWSMRPGWSLSMGYGFGGFGMGFGYGNPWMGGFYDPFYSPFYNPWYNPWNNPWYGGGWAGAGDWGAPAGPAIPRQPARSTRAGSAAPPRPRSVFTTPREANTANQVPASRINPAGRNATTPAGRQPANRVSPGQTPAGRQPTSTPSRINPAPSRSNPGVQPANRDGFNRPSAPTRPSTAPSTPPSRGTSPGYTPPSRGTSPGYSPPSRGGSTPSGGGGSRPAGTGGSRPR